MVRNQIQLEPYFIYALTENRICLRADARLPGQRARSGPSYSSQKDLIPDIQSLCQYLSPLFPNLSLTVFHFRNMTLRDSCQFRKLFLSHAFLQS